MSVAKQYTLSVTTQGPSYPPSEVMNKDGDFIVIGKLNLPDDEGGCLQQWGAALVSQHSAVPNFGDNLPYDIIRFIDCDSLSAEDDSELYTLPLPLPCNNYPMQFAPQQTPATNHQQCSYAFHQFPIPDLRQQDGRKLKQAVHLSEWIKAQGAVSVSVSNDKQSASFNFEFRHLIPNSLYTVMALREHDLDPNGLTRPGPLGVPNVFISDATGSASYHANMPNPFPSKDNTDSNRIINVVVLWMSSQMSYGGAIGHYGLGGDIHAQLKLTSPSFFQLETHA